VSLDFVVLGDDGAPDRVVPIGVDLHHQLISIATQFGLYRFDSFSDYYEDARIDEGDLLEFRQQVEILRSGTKSPQLLNFLGSLCDLIDYASEKGKPLHSIAD